METPKLNKLRADFLANGPEDAYYCLPLTVNTEFGQVLITRDAVEGSEEAVKWAEDNCGKYIEHVEDAMLNS